MAITQLQTKADVNDNPRAVIGGNRPPVAIEARAEFDDLIDANEGLRQRIEDLIGASERATATSEETMGRCGQTIIQIRAAMKKVEDAHTTAKAPYLEGGRVVDAAKKELLNPLEEAKKRIEGKQEGYLREQKKRDDERRAKAAAEQRRVDEENARLQRDHEESVRKAQQEAEEQGKPVEAIVVPAPVYVAPPPPPAVIERGIIRGAEGAAISGKKVWKSQVMDYEKAFAMVESNPKVREAIDAAVAALIRGGLRTVPGVRIWEDVAVSNR